MIEIEVAKEFLENKIPAALAVVLINLILLCALWSRVDDYEPRIRALEDFKLVIETREAK